MSRLKPKQQVPLCLVVIGIITAVLLASSCHSIHIPATRKPGDIISSNIVRRGDPRSPVISAVRDDVQKQCLDRALWSAEISGSADG